MVEFLCPQVIVAFIIDPIYLFTGREIHSCVAVYQGQRIFKSFETHLRTWTYFMKIVLFSMQTPGEFIQLVSFYVYSVLFYIMQVASEWVVTEKRDNVIGIRFSFNIHSFIIDDYKWSRFIGSHCDWASCGWRWIVEYWTLMMMGMAWVMFALSSLTSRCALCHRYRKHSNVSIK